MRPVFAVTGASGFVGSTLVPWLLSRGHQVVPVVRHNPVHPGLADVRPVWDLDDSEGLRRAFKSVDVVVHLAARVHVMREHLAKPLDAFRRINVEGTRAVHAAAREAGAKRVVFVSSIKAMGEAGPRPYRESDPPQPADPYGLSKWEAERALAAGRAQGGIEYVVLRPPLVYGPGVGGNFRRLLRIADLSRRLPLPLGELSNARSLISVVNLSSAIESAGFHPAAADRTFLVSDGHDLSTSEMLQRLAIGLGGPARLTRCPVRMIRFVAGALGRTNEVERLLGSLVVDSSLIQRALGWRPVRTVDEAFAETTAWWHTRHLTALQ